ncbi:SCO2525 family SAM-dependent methyltransferase [Luedemannella flava]|uniref:SCO2525 family SAM-dependent methyltransferase n=1 Tax=Luedemannella flava TaxID=349316 RepID=A0ABN2MJ16_9ACTN
MRPSTPRADPDAHPAAHGRNDEQPWDLFDTDYYWAHNYRTLQDVDQRILRFIGEFFDRQPLRGGHGIDVGTGANLYPVLAMLPLCQAVTLWEWSRKNAQWLGREVAHYRPEWDPFWAELVDRPSYTAVGDPRLAVADRAHVRHGHVFHLPRHTWDAGTMFFVAESMSALPEEFERALCRFVQSLRPGAPFAAAFMEGSEGYSVPVVFDEALPPVSYQFPAVPVGVDDVARCLATVAHTVDIQRIDRGDKPLREGYTGMIVAVGTAGPPNGA